MERRVIPTLTETDKKLPYYLIGAGCNWEQEHVVLPDGHYYQWIQCVKGEGELVTDEKNYRIKEGNALLLFKGTPHEYYAISSSWITNWVVFDGHQVEVFLKQMTGIKTSCALYTSAPSLFLSKIKNLLEVEESDHSFKSLQSSNIIYSLLIDIIQYASVHPNNSASIQYAKLRPLFNFIEMNFDKHLTLEEMADIIEITPQHLCTIFKKATNIRIFQYINSVRIKKSKELLLQNPQLKIKELASMVGFENVNYFCTVFKKLEHLTPTQYRKIN